MPGISGGSTASSGPIRDAISGRLEGTLPEIRPGFRQLVLPAACTCFVTLQVSGPCANGWFCSRTAFGLPVADEP